jgi:hypothetical protein
MQVFVGTEEDVRQKIFSGEYKACSSCLVVYSSGTELVVAELDHVDDEKCINCLLTKSDYLCSKCEKDIAGPVELEEPPDPEAEILEELERTEILSESEKEVIQ